MDSLLADEKHLVIHWHFKLKCATFMFLFLPRSSQSMTIHKYDFKPNKPATSGSMNLNKIFS
jgi:hypothetical protein